MEKALRMTLSCKPKMTSVLQVTKTLAATREADEDKAAMIRDADKDESEGDNEGMTQLRGEASKDQDKFRCTVEREQVCMCTEASQGKWEA